MTSNRKFAIFILSHARAATMATLKSVQEAGYTGDWYIIIDDLDEQKDLYVEKYGEHVVVFDKLEWQAKTDTVTITGELGSPVFARNACYAIAEKLGLDYFTEFDDDIKSFHIRYVDEGKLRSHAIRNFDEVCDIVLDFMDVSGAVGCNITNSGSYAGGMEGKFSKGLGRNFNQAFFLRRDKKVEFKGIMNEDGIATRWCDNTGLFAWEIFMLCQTCPKRASNTGGLNALYQIHSEYSRAFHEFITMPQCQKITESKKGAILLTRKTEHSYPKILSDRWRKNA